MNPRNRPQRLGDGYSGVRPHCTVVVVDRDSGCLLPAVGAHQFVTEAGDVAPGFIGCCPHVSGWIAIFIGQNRWMAWCG